MNTLHRYEGKSLEALKNQCLEELNTAIDDLYIFETEETGLLKSKKYIIEVITKKEIIDQIKDFINELSKKMNIEIHSEIRIEENNINVLLVTDNNNIMIGKDGKTLNSIQIILRQYMNNLNKFGLRIIVDVGNYKNKKLKNLEYEVRKICKDVLKTKVEVKLDPMNSFERRKVHSIVSEFECLESASYGEDPNRYTVIKFKD